MTPSLLRCGLALAAPAIALTSLSWLPAQRPAQDFTLLAPTAAEPRFDVSASAAWLATTAMDTPDAQRSVGTTSWTMLALLGSGSTMRTGPHREPLKKLVVWLRSSQTDTGHFASAGVPCSRTEQIVATVAMQRTFVLSNYQLLRPTVAQGIRAIEAAIRAPDVAPLSVEEAAILAWLATTLVEGQQAAEAARLKDLAKAALATHRFGKARPTDAALHLGQLLTGVEHPPELTVARCWPANLTADPLHTLFGVVAAQHTDAKTWAAQSALLKDLLGARAPGAEATWPAVGELDAATTTAILATAVALGNVSGAAPKPAPAEAVPDAKK